MSKIKTNQIAAFLNTAPGEASASWGRIRKQDELKIKYDVTTDEDNFVDEEGPTTSVEKYSVSFDGEMVAMKGDEVFKYLDSLRQNRATGTDAETEVLLVYIYDSTGSGSSTTYKAEKSKATVTVSEFGGEGGGGSVSIGYSVNLNGDPTKGTCTISDGAPTFAEKSDT